MDWTIHTTYMVSPCQQKLCQARTEKESFAMQQLLLPPSVRLGTRDTASDDEG